jgi:phosphoglycerol transferase MdoB-like AlkP superfamily enzyme
VQQEAANKPKHIYLMIMESYDGWALLPEYEQLHIADGVKSLLQSGGMAFPSFTSASHGTMSSLAAILTGLPDAQVNTNYQANARQVYPTALAHQFKKFGYKTRLFYGGYLSWQRIEDFARDQGIDEVYGASHMASWINTNEWGVPDQNLFDFIAQHENIDDRPTLNIILSTSNHPPFSVNLKEAGFDEARMQKLLDTRYPNAGATAKTLGHFWYADKVLTQFVKNRGQKEPNSLFVITGDHFGRRHVKPNPPLYETKAVPCVWYGPQVLQAYQGINTNERAGGHLDIGPTLIEMVAPKGFIYPSIGRNLFAKNTDRLNVGLGNGILMLPGYRVWTWDPNQAAPDTVTASSTQSKNSIVSNHHEVYYRAMMSLAWWRITKGEALP